MTISKVKINQFLSQLEEHCPEDDGNFGFNGNDPDDGDVEVADGLSGLG